MTTRRFTFALKSARRILEDHPELSFDLEESLLSLPEVGALTRRLAAFNKSRYRRRPEPVAARDIREVLQSSRLSKVRAYEGVTGEDARALPLVERQTLQRNSSRYINREFADKPLWVTTTYGTTGFPIAIYNSAVFYFDQLFLSLVKISARIGFDAEPKRVYAVHVTDTRGQRITINPMGRNEATLRLIIDQFDEESIGRMFSILIKLQPSILCARSEIIEVLAQFAECSRYRPRLVVCSGSVLTDERRSQFKGRFGCPVVNAYGLTEFGLVASECLASPGWLHIDGSTVWHELRSVDGVDSAQELVLSSVANMAMPLLRYNTGDIVQTSRVSCKCGSTDEQISMLNGRLVPTFRRRSGRLFSPTVFNGLSSALPIAEYRVVQESLGRLAVLINPRKRASVAALTQATVRHVRAASRNEFEVRVGQLGSHETPDFQRYRCLLPVP